jgi:hypothetical protein
MNAKTQYVINLPTTNYFLKVHEKDGSSWAVGEKNATHFSSEGLAQKALNDSGLEGCEVCALTN